MKKTILMTTLLAMPFVLAACDKPANPPKVEASTDEMGNMAMPAGTKMGKGSGMITAIDKDAGKVTIEHGPIAELKWPAMKMGFNTKPEILDSVAIGDKIDFDVAVTGKESEITSLTKR